MQTALVEFAHASVFLQCALFERDLLQVQSVTFGANAAAPYEFFKNFERMPPAKGLAVGSIGLRQLLA